MTAAPAGTALAATGERVEQLLEASAAAGPVARERAEELVRLVVELYGAGLERVLELVAEAGALDDALLDALAGDELVAGLLLVHGLHPYGVVERVEQALDGVRPYLGSHGGDVRLREVTGDGVVRLELLGSCDGCASSAATLELAVQEAVLAAAPEVVRIDVVPGARAAAAVIPVEQLTARLRAPAPAGEVAWLPAARVEEVAVGALRPARVGGVDLLLCRLPAGVYAYRDGCARCGAPLAGGGLSRAPAAPASAVLTCPGCGAHFDVRRAGADVDEPARHLEPVPLLERSGFLEVALRSPAAPVPA